MRYVLKADGQEHPAVSYTDALLAAVSWAHAAGVPVSIHSAGWIGEPLLRVVQPTDTLASLRS